MPSEAISQQDQDAHHHYPGYRSGQALERVTTITTSPCCATSWKTSFNAAKTASSSPLTSVLIVPGSTASSWERRTSRVLSMAGEKCGCRSGYTLTWAVMGILTLLQKIDRHPDKGAERE